MSTIKRILDKELYHAPLEDEVYGKSSGKFKGRIILYPSSQIFYSHRGGIIMSIDGQLESKLKQLRLTGILETLEIRLRQAEESNSGYLDFI